MGTTMTVEAIPTSEQNPGETGQMNCPDDCEFCSSPETD